MHTPNLHSHFETKPKETKPPNNKQKKIEKKNVSVETLLGIKTKNLAIMFLPPPPIPVELCVSVEVCKALNFNSTKAFFFCADLRNEVFFP